MVEKVTYRILFGRKVFESVNLSVRAEMIHRFNVSPTQFMDVKKTQTDKKNSNVILHSSRFVHFSESHKEKNESFMNKRI